MTQFGPSLWYFLAYLINSLTSLLPHSLNIATGQARLALTLTPLCLCLPVTRCDQRRRLSCAIWWHLHSCSHAWLPSPAPSIQSLALLPVTLPMHMWTWSLVTTPLLLLWPPLPPLLILRQQQPPASIHAAHTAVLLDRTQTALPFNPKPSNNFLSHLTPPTTAPMILSDPTSYQCRSILIPIKHANLLAVLPICLTGSHFRAFTLGSPRGKDPLPQRAI